ncbi:initiation factor 2 [Choiromyces venosus 120613-1]|uniref:Translation initiation factor IF-2, mitochondrial n=1 Tax=Choiromyces venosus 120613-1 TaxID=1336337 RepID=A0A3N4JSQ5_9PEZI|nr:initiation factor 2 [Choiromyces venosus 120613-1]
MLRTSRCSVKKPPGLPLSLCTIRNFYRLYPRLLHSSRKSSDSDASGSAAVAEDNKEPTYTTSDSFQSFRKPGAYSTRRPETRWSVPPPNGHSSADTNTIGNGTRNGPPSRWSSGGTSNSAGPTSGSVLSNRYGRNQQSPYGPPSRWGNSGGAAAGGDPESKFGSRPSWGVRPAPKPASTEDGTHDTRPPPSSGPSRSWGGSRTKPDIPERGNQNTSSAPSASTPRWTDPPPQRSFGAKEGYQRTERVRGTSPIRTPWGSRTTDDSRSGVSNIFSSGGPQSPSPELRKREGSINYTREFDQVEPQSGSRVGQSSQSESPSAQASHSRLGQSIPTDRELPVYTPDARNAPFDIKGLKDYPNRRSTSYISAEQNSKIKSLVDEVSATYVPIGINPPNTTKAEEEEEVYTDQRNVPEGNVQEQNVQEGEARIMTSTSDHVTRRLRTRPLTPAELEYERRQSAKTRERSRRREFDSEESAIIEGDEEPLTGKAAKKAKKARKREKRVEAAPAMIPLYLPEYISVANLARAVKMRLDDFIVQMQNMGFEDVSHDHVMNAEVAGLIAMEYGYEPIADTSKEEDLLPRPPPEDKSVLQPRPPIVTIMGHVDHGKTTILDWLRKSSIVATEHGGITQHIGAFSVTMPSGKIITFLDTPGHSAFLSMRERGANVTDIVILVVAADDSVKPQTIEAIKHAKAANVPIIVAINKIDKEGTDIDAVKQDLAKNGVDIEDFGGDTQVVLVSGKTGQGMEGLEEAAVTLSEVLDMRAETDGPCEGWVLEAGTEKRGRVATALVNRGTLRPGDIIVAGQTWSRVRSLINEHGVEVEFAGPGTPVTVDGWRDQPLAGDSILQAVSEASKKVINFRMEKAERLRQATDMEAINNQRRAQREKEAAEKEIREQALANKQDPDAAVAASEKLAAEGRKKYEVVNFIVKGDVAGSVEAVVESVSPLGNEEVGAKVIRSSFGAVTEFDVDHAAAAEGYILCFNLAVDPEIIQYARNKGVTIMTHNVIYRLVEEVTAKLSERLPPLIKYSVKAEAEILQVFSINLKKRKTAPVAGSQVKNGNLYKHDKVRVLRDGKIIYDGEFDSMKIFTKEATEVKKGGECGLGFKGWGEFQPGDMIQTYEVIEEARTI